MRILHTLNDVRELGNGIVNVAADLACAQAAAGHVVGVAAGRGEYETLLREHGVRYFPIDQRRSAATIAGAARRFRAIVREFRPEIVHAHVMTSVVLARALRPGTRYRIVSHAHNAFRRSAVLMGLADRVIAVSTPVSEEMARRGIPARKLRVVHNRTLGSPRLPSADACAPAPLRQPAIVTVAGMYRRKGIGELIQAFERVAAGVPDAQLYLVGDGPDRMEFVAQAATTTCAPRIHFEGFQRNPKPYLLAAPVFVLASHRDPAPLVISEAREIGRAIVATAVDGIPEQLDGGRSGLLVPPHDPSALAEALLQVLTDPAERRRWEAAAKQDVGRFSVEQMAADTIDVYRELVAAPAGAVD